MGINGLWDVLGQGEVITIAKYATRHFELHNRPLRIAVDEAGWRFNNLNDAQVAYIRQGEAAANPVEKNIVYRILKLYKLGIQLLFVFDGPRRPGKRGRNGGAKLDYDRINLLSKILDILGVPHHRAPGEAEAECARLQQLGVVDAVWSDDSDTLMFGAKTVVQAHKVNGKRVDDTIRVYCMERIERELDFNADSFVLFALLAGGDYNVQGLEGCGPKKAAQLCKISAGLAGRLRHWPAKALRHWSAIVQVTVGSGRDFQPSFPDQRAMKYYQHPTVTSDDKLLDLNGLKRGWNKPIDQVKMRECLRDQFNFQTPQLLKHIGPLLLSRLLMQSDSPERLTKLMACTIRLKPRRARKDEVVVEQFEKRIEFSPTAVFNINVKAPAHDENWEDFGKQGVAFSPSTPIECEILSYILDHALPAGCLQEAAPRCSKTRKRTAPVDSVEEYEPRTSIVEYGRGFSELRTSAAYNKAVGTNAREATDTIHSSPNKRPRVDGDTAAVTLSQPATPRSRQLISLSQPTPRSATIGQISRPKFRVPPMPDIQSHHSSPSSTRLEMEAARGRRNPAEQPRHALPERTTVATKKWAFGRESYNMTIPPPGHPPSAFAIYPSGRPEEITVFDPVPSIELQRINKIVIDLLDGDDE